MNTVFQVLRYGVLQNIRSRALIVFGIFFFVTTWSMLELQRDSDRAVTALLQLVVLLVPLVGFVYGALYFYNSREFIELLLVQPVARGSVYIGHYLGLTLPFIAMFLLSAGLPFVWSDIEDTSALLLLLLVGGFLFFITTALAYWIALSFDDRVKGLGIILFVWLAFAFLYDGFLLAGSLLLQGYPLEIPLLIASVLNPVDLSRIAVLMRLDVAALMGPTGMVFEKNLGATRGLFLAIWALGLWTVLPFILGLRRFRKKDF